MSIRVYVVEDHPVMREMLADYLELSPDIDLCGMAPSAEQALDELDRVRPHVVLLDLSLPGRSGLDLLTEIRERWSLPCVILSGHGEQSYVGRALSRGARGYVLKGAPEEVPAAIRSAAAGHVFVSGSLKQDPRPNDEASSTDRT